jgi:dTDP-4-dehydrorhamnose reductase
MVVWPCGQQYFPFQVAMEMAPVQSQLPLTGGVNGLKKILVLGAAGMLGHKLCQCLPAEGCDVVATVRQDVNRYASYDAVFGRTRLIGGVDAMNFEALASVVRSERPSAIVNCIGLIKQHREAENRMLAVALNSYLPHRLDTLCHEIGARLVHFSTDCVFSGHKGSYREADVSDAEDVYGRSKYLGETEHPEGDAVTLRSSIIGRELIGPRHGLFEWFLGQRGKRIGGFTRAIYTGFTTIEMARIVALVLARKEPLRGVYQVASAPISKFDLLCLLREIGGYPVEIDANRDFACDRSLVMDRFTADTGYVAPAWKPMLEEMIADPTPYDAYEAAHV